MAAINMTTAASERVRLAEKAADHQEGDDTNKAVTNSAQRYKILIPISFLTIVSLIIIVIVIAVLYIPPDTSLCGNKFSDSNDDPLPDGNQHDFNTTVCEGYRNLWQDPSIPLSERNQIGRAIYQTPAKMEEAMNEIQVGKSYNLYRPYSDRFNVPAWGRYFNRSLICEYYAQWDSGACTQKIETSAIGNIGTQFDSFGHWFHVDVDKMNASNISADSGDAKFNEYYVFFNNFRGNDVFDLIHGNGDVGVNYLGIHLLPTFFTRAILVDIAGYKGVDRLEKQYGITNDEFLGALKAQSLSIDDIRKGDAVFIYTGYGNLLDVDNDSAAFNDFFQAPGILEEVITESVFNTNAMIIGSDTPAVDVIGLDEWGSHNLFMQCGGGFIHEGVKLDEWVKDARNGSVSWIGAYIFQPLPVMGGVGGAGKPVVFV